MQELEIEYKNLLTREEYDEILDKEFFTYSENSYSKILQKNYYFDTKNHLLKNQEAALRIRKLEDRNELTFKVPSNHFLMETNLPLSDSAVKKILKEKNFALHSLTDKSLDLKLKNINQYSIFSLINSFKTLRYEKKVKNNLLVLDQTFFQNGSVDYELEVEGKDPNEARTYFNSLLVDYSIPDRGNEAKIARAEKNK